MCVCVCVCVYNFNTQEICLQLDINFFCLFKKLKFEKIKLSFVYIFNIHL